MKVNFYRNQFVTMFPYIEPTSEFDFVINEVLPWSNSYDTECIIVGSLNLAGQMNFFATDYRENMEIYNNEKEIKANLGAFAFSIEKFENIPENFAKTFCGYMPIEGAKMYYWSIFGDLKSIRDINDNLKILEISMFENNEVFHTINIVMNNKFINCELILEEKYNINCWVYGELNKQ